MKAILEFDLPEEQEDLNKALNGAEAHSVLFTLDQTLRSHVKHGSNKDWDTETVIKIRDHLSEITADLNIL